MLLLPTLLCLASDSIMAISARQEHTMEDRIPLVLIEVSPFLSLPTLRALVCGPETLRGGLEGSQHFGDGSQWPQTPAPESDQPTSRFVGYVLSQESDALKQNLVKEIKTPEASVSMHPRAKNGI